VTTYERYERRRPQKQKEEQQQQRFLRPRNCRFCADGKIVIDYKNTELLQGLVYEDGKIRPRRQTGSCAKHQREVTQAVKRARHIALLPFVGEILR